MRTIQVGSDLVEVAEDHIVINARRPFVDWRIREFCRQPIFFKGQKLFLRDRHQGTPPYAIRYELEPWPEDLHDQSSASFVYDESLVSRRDAEFQTERRRTALWYLLLPLYPLLGLCWSGFKERVLWPVGFEPKSITSASIMLVFCVTFCDAIFFGFLGGGIIIGLFGVHAIGGWAFVADLLLIGLLTLDCATRFSQLIKGDDVVPQGFLEWLVPHRWRNY